MNPLKSRTIIPLLFFSCFLFQLVTAQDPPKAPVLMTFEREEVDLAEFQRVYQKNNGGAEAVKEHTVDQYREYLDLYVNFKRKVFAAEDQGIHETESFKNEFGTYKKQLVEPYMSAKEVEDRLIQEAYERSKLLVSASHILISVGKDALPSDTLTAFTKALAIKDSLANQRVDFATMASRHSQDPSAKTNAGELGFFGVFDMVYPFENAAYETAVGQVSDPVRTVYGYHVVKVNERIENQGKKKAAHIIIRIGDRYSAKDSVQAEEKILELYQKVQAGGDFAQLAQQFSDDPQTAPKGGDLGMMRLLPEMETQKLNLAEGEVSKPFKTKFGLHLLKVTEVEKSGDFESSQANLKQRISRDSRSKLGQEALLNRIKNESGYREYADNLAKFSKDLPSQFATGAWKPDSTQEDLYQLPLFEVKGKETVLIQDMIDHYLDNRRKFSRLPANQQAAQVVKNDFVKSWLLAYEEEQLPKKNPEFRHLLKEYRDGIMLFTLMEDKVWKKAVEDTTGLQEYYQAHQDSFFAEESMDLREYRCTSDSIAKAVYELLVAKANDDTIDSLLNQQSSLNVRILTLNYEKGKSDISEDVFTKEIGYIREPREENGYYLIQVIAEKFPAGIKLFDKAKSEVITKYQDHLEKEWLKELEQKYPVTIHEEVFSQLFQ
ncbi:MAG: peptidylprolyl isomerase [Bacteroidota bacterium]